MKKYKCVLCKKKFEGYGNNPKPLFQKGLCCDMCNLIEVVPARLIEYQKQKEENRRAR